MRSSTSSTSVKDRGVGADAQCDRHERDDREERRARQPAPGVLKVAKKVTHR
jgi:hypothetical protein